MKKILLTIALILLIPALSYGADGSCTQSAYDFSSRNVQHPTRVIILACTGSTVDGSLPDTALNSTMMKLIEGTHYFYSITAYPTSGGTPPDAADVFILDEDGVDLLGSTDGGVTANKGANLIHATLPKRAFAYVDGMGAFYTPPVTTGLTVRVSNQATASANYTLKLVFQEKAKGK